MTLPLMNWVYFCISNQFWSFQEPTSFQVAQKYITPLYNIVSNLTENPVRRRADIQINFGCISNFIYLLTFIRSTNYFKEADWTPFNEFHQPLRWIYTSTMKLEKSRNSFSSTFNFYFIGKPSIYFENWEFAGKKLSFTLIPEQKKYHWLRFINTGLNCRYHGVNLIVIIEYCNLHRRNLFF